MLSELVYFMDKSPLKDIVGIMIY